MRKRERVHQWWWREAVENEKFICTDMIECFSSPRSPQSVLKTNQSIIEWGKCERDRKANFYFYFWGFIVLEIMDVEDWVVEFRRAVNYSTIIWVSASESILCTTCIIIVYHHYRIRINLLPELCASVCHIMLRTTLIPPHISFITRIYWTWEEVGIYMLFAASMKEIIKVRAWSIHNKIIIHVLLRERNSLKHKTHN